MGRMRDKYEQREDLRLFKGALDTKHLKKGMKLYFIVKDGEDWEGPTFMVAEAEITAVGALGHAGKLQVVGGSGWFDPNSGSVRELRAALGSSFVWSYQSPRNFPFKIGHTLFTTSSAIVQSRCERMNAMTRKWEMDAAKEKYQDALKDFNEARKALTKLLAKSRKKVLKRKRK